MKKAELIFSALIVPVDFIMLVGAGLFAYFLRTSSLISYYRPVLFELDLPISKYFWLLIVVALFWVFIFAIAGLYRLKSTRSTLEEFFQVIIASSAGMMSIIIYIFVRGEFFNSRFIILAAWIFAVIFVTFGRFFMRYLQKYLIDKYNFGIHKIMIIGKDDISSKITREIVSRPSSGYRVVKRLLSPDIEELDRAVSNPGIDEVVLADPNYPKDKILELVDFCEEKHLYFKFVPNLFQTLTTNIGFDTFTGIPLIELKRTRLDGWGRIVKRGVDIFGSIAGITVFLPIMAVIAAIIKFESHGPVIYKNERVGQKKNFFTYKFRSMKYEYCTGKGYDKNNIAGSFEDKLVVSQSFRKGPVFKIKDDPRRTKFGRWLERTSLDELPQFFNVLKGDMSLVGPRPHMPKEVARYNKFHKKVFNIKPGVTGLAQVSGRSDLDFDDEAKLDIYYIENWSFKMDLTILFKTPIAVLFKRHKR